ncbi:polysaccharide export outer membrane protein [Roseivivax marinus]|uniref:polysaccharide biosynthesis/export family protein n=1 Tax=Roseivivax marinus TaxID=1379903 RepID=UPI0008BC684A|nr:polysaccharide biosynthesis/export family protein [Roseivivax marinus]SEK69817.1 polysaccharide export outer membrane protein [Roseivivax marinus]
MLRILTFLCAAMIASAGLAQGEYRVRTGDTLTIEVLEDTSLNRSVVVLPDGRVSFPYAGSVPAAGRTVEQIRSSIAESIAPNFNEPPNVFLSVRPAPPEPAPPPAPPAPVAPPAPDPVISIYVLGEVEGAGRIEVAPGTTFLQALAQAGGLTPFAATKRVQLRRTDPISRVQRVYVINFRALTNGAAMRADVPLREGDVILVPERRLFE